jgi:hypothetical protein
LIASLVFGMGKDVDHSAGDADHGAEAHGDSFGWLPLASVRFWTFFLGFGGLTGTTLTYMGGINKLVVGGAAFGIAWLAGVAMVAALKKASSGPGSEVTPRDLRGETAEVLLPVAKGKIGKVRVVAKGRTHDLIAETDEDKTFASGQKVMIIGEGEEGRVQVGETGETT